MSEMHMIRLLVPVYRLNGYLVCYIMCIQIHSQCLGLSTLFGNFFGNNWYTYEKE